MTELEKLFSKRKTTRAYLDKSVLEINEQLQKDEPELIIIQANYELLTTKLSVLDSLQENIENIAEDSNLSDLIQESFSYRTVLFKTKISAENFIQSSKTTSVSESLENSFSKLSKTPASLP